MPSAKTKVENEKRNNNPQDPGNRTRRKFRLISLDVAFGEPTLISATRTKQTFRDDSFSVL
jgi:hypothetical protein